MPFYHCKVWVSPTLCTQNSLNKLRHFPKWETHFSNYPVISSILAFSSPPPKYFFSDTPSCIKTLWFIYFRKLLFKNFVIFFLYFSLAVSGCLLASVSVSGSLSLSPHPYSVTVWASLSLNLTDLAAMANLLCGHWNSLPIEPSPGLED